MNDLPNRDVEVFTEALRLPLGERAAYLERACGTDGDMRDRVEALLRTHEQVGDFLEEPPQKTASEAKSGISVGEKPGDRIGCYKLLQQIGEGGCGAVFMAEQEEPVRRRVALKIIKPGMDTKSVITRFEAERQALALMDHPNIAKVFDAGATESGRPYFVMELVRGIKITEYCDQNSLTTEERLKLFVQVCHAVQHAHQKGVIHRDIKPSNILVTSSLEGAPLPVVIDFGIAKATTNQRLTDKTLFTAFEMLIGTPAYMSPEQAALTSVDVDTRTDIYSLGVLLYELLTGLTPFDTGELLKAGLDEVRRVIREQEPLRPSTKLSGMTGADLTTVAQHRKSEPPRLIRAISGDLDWIAMKALEKDRTRRYETANGLALDVQRFLANEVISARPPSIVPDLRGAGGSSKPESGYDKKNMAVDVHELVTSLGFKRASIVGHDIGLMVAYAYAAQFPQETERLVLMDAFLPGIGDWKNVWLMRDLWHFHFYGEVPLALVKGRERTYFEHFWNDFAADRKHSVSEADRQLYAKAYAQPGGMRAGFEYFRNFERDAQDFAALSTTPLAMPVLVLGGEKSGGEFLIAQTKLAASNVQGKIISGSGHWLIDEAPQIVIPALTAFLNGSRGAASGLRLTVSEIEALPPVGAGTGTSGVSGIQTRVLAGNPNQPGTYTIQLSVPANTRIEAHDHPDDRVVTVISGTWHFGYGASFDEKALKELPPGSFYTEPPNEPHFARTGGTPAVIQITGFGPSGTRYQNQRTTK